MENLVESGSFFFTFLIHCTIYTLVLYPGWIFPSGISRNLFKFTIVKRKKNCKAPATSRKSAAENAVISEKSLTRH